MGQSFILAHSEARLRALQAVQEAPDGYSVKVDEPRRNLEQNALLHALLTDIAKRRTWADKTWDAEDWKRFLTAAWCRVHNEQIVMVPALDGHGFEVLYRRTSQLTKRECADLITFIEAWDATTNS
jgi:hypothetical protein